MGHTRMAMQESEKQNCNNHPFKGINGQDRFSPAHNGVLYNDHVLQKIHIYRLHQSKQKVMWRYSLWKKMVSYPSTILLL